MNGRGTGTGAPHSAGGSGLLMGDRTAPTPLIFERSIPGRRASTLPSLDVDGRPVEDLLQGAELASSPPPLPEVNERDIVQHYTRLSQRNHGIDLGHYPLGSCTMKYNPKVAERVAALPGFAGLHPATPAAYAQGTLAVLHEVEQWVCELTGMAAATLQPSAGAQGELVGLMVMRAFHEHRGDARRTVIIPDSAHGTNPASVTLGGYRTVTVPSDRRGLVDVDALARLVDEDAAGLMLTNPNTLGLFETDIERIAGLLHDVGALLYYDGANFNAILGRVRPGDMGFDIVHLNVHKTFATPHGGGGPGGGPVGVSQRLAPYLPGPMVVRAHDGSFTWRTPERSLGRVHGWYGNVGIMVRALAYLIANGGEGLRRVAELAVLNANYLAERVRDTYPLAFDGRPMHEFVCVPPGDLRGGIKNMDLAKRLIDLGFHPPTVSFPLIVPNCFMVEPTETEAPETLDAFADAMLQAVADAREDPDWVRRAPVTTPVARLDEARAARDLRPRWRPPATPDVSDRRAGERRAAPG
ncbi:MAG TPA: aminomethyl-transferring glycine dehydrogenase subunit GcvPB [Nitriliruptorales bacterium]|nr:aminomethyl-transferring glycine dehydrogenase subunit GcvPB [Nitriliruptorales bacterium]